MSKRRSIISYDKLTLEQKKQILREFPDGYINHLTTIKTPKGEVLDALIWDTEEVVYLVKITKPKIKAKAIADEEVDFEEDPALKDDELESDSDDEESDDYDKPDKDDEDDTED